MARALAYILDRQLPSLLHLVHEQAETGRDMGQLLSEIMGAVRELLIAKVAPQEAGLSLPEQWRESLSALISRTPTDKIVRLMEVLSGAEEHMRWSTNKRLHLEMGLIQAVHSLAEANISDIIRALNGAPLPDTPIATAPLPAVPVMPTAVAVQQPPAPHPLPPAPQPEPVFEPEPAPMPPGLEPIDDAPPMFGDMPLPEEISAPAPSPAPSSGPMTPEMWNALVAELQNRAPLKAGMIGHTLFAGDEDGLVTIGLHPEDTDTRDALLEEDLRQLINELAPGICGHGITLRLVMDDSVPPPVVEAPPPPPPLPEPTPRTKPQPQAAPKPAPAPKPEAPPSLRPTDEEFYHDPLVELALKEFHASIIKQ